jgi:hypothetical protein
MLLNAMEVGQWTELTRIARVELILDQVELLLTGLDLERSHPMFMIWEQETEHNGKALEKWVAWITGNPPFDDWLSNGLLDGPPGHEVPPMGDLGTHSRPG